MVGLTLALLTNVCLVVMVVLDYQKHRIRNEEIHRDEKRYLNYMFYSNIGSVVYSLASLIAFTKPIQVSWVLLSQENEDFQFR